MTEGRNKAKMTYALWLMCTGKHKIFMSINKLEKFKIEYSKNCSGKNNPNYGRKHSDESRKKMSGKTKKMFGVDNHFYGRKHSDESRKKMSETKKLKPMSKESREIISSYKRGIPASEESRKNLLRGALETFPCHQCGKQFNKGNLSQHLRSNKCLNKSHS